MEGGHPAGRHETPPLQVHCAPPPPPTSSPRWPVSIVKGCVFGRGGEGEGWEEERGGS